MVRNPVAGCRGVTIAVLIYRHRSTRTRAPLLYPAGCDTAGRPGVPHRRHRAAARATDSGRKSGSGLQTPEAKSTAFPRTHRSDARAGGRQDPSRKSGVSDSETSVRSARRGRLLCAVPGARPTRRTRPSSMPPGAGHGLCILPRVPMVSRTRRATPLARSSPAVCAACSIWRKLAASMLRRSTAMSSSCRAPAGGRRGCRPTRRLAAEPRRARWCDDSHNETSGDVVDTVLQSSCRLGTFFCATSSQHGRPVERTVGAWWKFTAQPTGCRCRLKPQRTR